MKQKIKQLQSFLLLLILSVVGTASVWGDPTYKSDYSDFTAIDGSTAKYMWIPKSTIDEADWISANSTTNGSQKQNVFINPATGEQSTSSTSANYYRPKDRSGSKHLTFYLTNVTEVSFYAYNSSTSKTLTAKVNNGAEQTIATTDADHKSIVGTISGLDANTNYTIEVYNQSSSSGASEMYIGAIKVTPGSSVSMYSVTYDGNGSDGGTAVSDPSSPYASGSNVTVLSNTWTKTGYNFSTWNTAADGSGTDYAPVGTISSIGANTALYAQWTPATYTITLNANGGAGGSSSVTATYDSNVLPSFDAPIKSNSILKGYYTAASDGTKVINADGTLEKNVSGYTDGSGNWERTSGATLYAQWDAVYTVTFDATTNGGTCSTASLTQESAGASIILPNAAKEDNTFNGWFTAASGGTLAGLAGAEYTPAANVTLYAQFSSAVSTTKFSMVRVGTGEASIAIGETHTLTSSEATITGASSVTVKNEHDKDSQKYLMSNNGGCFFFGTNKLYFKLELTNALAQGDVISYTGYNSKQLCFTTSDAYDNTISTSEYSYEIPSGSPLIGATTIYVWRAAANSTYFNDLTITSSGEAPTYTVSFDLATMADDIEALEDQIALPNPLPTPTNVASGYTFEGWYTNDTYTTRATAGAAINTNTTLYANYIIDTPTISQNGGAIYSNKAMSLTSDVPFTHVYAQWKTTDGAFDKETGKTLEVYPNGGAGGAIDTYNFTSWNTTGTSYFTYMISDGTFYSNPVVTAAFTVKHLITITTQPTSATYIKDATATPLAVVASVSNGATPTYLWKTSTDGSSWSNASGTNNQATYTPSTSTAGDTYYKCIISSTGADDVETNVVTVTVNESAAFTVSFDAGVGSDSTPEDATQASAGAAITLPSLTVKENYHLEGWYLDDAKVANADATTYTPSGNVTLVAKYNCLVLLEKTGDGNLPTAVIKSTSAPIASGDYVFEGTEITLTASPADKFINWTKGMTGTTNPKDYVVNEYKKFIANYEVSTNTTLFHTDFTESGWSSINGVDGGGVATNVGDGGNQTVTLEARSGDSYGWTSGTLTYVPRNYGSTDYIAIPVSGVNGALEITVANGSSKTQFKYNVVLGSSTDNPGSGTSSTSGTPSTVTVNALTASNYVVYIGRQSGTYTKITEITITTPTTKLAADSAQVRILGTNDVVAPVQISTNSTGTISIKTAPNGSVAEASYNSGTKVLTITSKGEGTTSVVMQITADGSHPAKELTIPITVEAKKITIKTQPTNISCYQNDASEKKFTVVATVNTGNDLTYQWYTCDSEKGSQAIIPGATLPSYTLNTNDKDEVGTKYFFCRVTSPNDSPVLTQDTEVRSVTVSAISAGGTYNTTVYAITPGNVVTYTGLSNTSVSSDTGSSYYGVTNPSSGTLTITATATGEGTITLGDGTIINVTVKNHTVNLIWTAESKQYEVSDWTTGRVIPIDGGSNPENLPYLIRQYEDGSPYEGTVTFYIDDPNIAYFGDTPGTRVYEQTYGGAKPVIRYGGSQGGCKFYAYISHAEGIDAVKASYDLRLIKGISNALPDGRKVAVQQQYTLYKNETDKLVTVTYGGYKYNNGTWSGKTDSWGSATNYVGKDNAIDGFLYAVRNKERDASDEYMHAIQDEDDFGSAWYASGEGGTTAAYQRIKPFRLPCRASYLTFTAHKSGTLTAYVYQNGIIGRGGNANQLASAPRLGYWFDEEGWLIKPTGTVLTKQTIAANNGRDQRVFSGNNNDEQMTAYWTNTEDAIVITKLRSKWCSTATPDEDTPASSFSNADTKPYGWYDNPYYWGTKAELQENLAEIVPTPERPIPHQGGHMIVNEGYVKYTINVEAGKTYYFFGKMTKVGYAGMTFVEADSENRKAERVDLNTADVWTSKFGEDGSALKDNATTIYNEITVPSNYRIGKWNTICLPFAVNENQVEQVFGKDTELAIFNGLRHDTENHVYYIKYLRHVDQNILPGQPYLIYPTGRAVEERTNQENGGMVETGEDVPTVGDSDPIIGSTIAGSTRLTFRNVIINKGITAQSYGCDVDADGTTTSYVFTGTDQQKAIEKYDLYNTPKTGELKRYMGAGTTLNTYHALIKAYSEEIKKDAITFAFTEEDIEKSWESNIDDEDPGEATGIVIIEDEGFSEVRNSGRVTNGKSYNMMGQEVDPTSAKGIILINGKKVMY